MSSISTNGTGRESSVAETAGKATATRDAAGEPQPAGDTTVTAETPPAAPKPVTRAAPARRRRPATPATPKPKTVGEKAGGRSWPRVDLKNLGAPENILNRELTWLEFNKRVLAEACDAQLPLLERVKFLAIVSSNLDEFFMKRVGGLKQQVGAGLHRLTADGRTPQEQIDESCAVIRSIEEQSRDAFKAIEPLLRDNGIEICGYGDLNLEEQSRLREYYYDNLYPLVTPQAMDPAHPFPFISNLSMNLLVALRHPGEAEELLARVKVPVGDGSPRFLRVGEGDRFVALEDIMAHNLDLLFPGMEIISSWIFRVTRNANTERDEEEADDLLGMIESELRDRKLSPIVRMEVMSGMSEIHRGMLSAELGLNEQHDVFESGMLLGMRDLMELAQLDRQELHDPDHRPVDNPKLVDDNNIFHVIRNAGPILLHHPYESFSTSVERFVCEASQDPKVLAIKMTLYRTSAGTRIIDYLIDAARNGKQVAVVVELKARFDEAANIRWASRLEEYGIHVTYGVVGLKTHSKVILVVRKDYYGLRRYAHIGTGNYHAGTARLYADLGLLTCDEGICQGLTEIFNYLTTGYKPKRDYKKVLPAPKVLKKALLNNIEREIELHSDDSPGLIRFKANALEDTDIVEALYKASQAGVKVEMVIRDTCRLRPGIPGLSENIRVVSIVGRFLEHTRIYHFRNGGADEYLIGSADLMKRNLESRVEVVVPIEDPVLQADLSNILDIQLADDWSGWEMQPDGAYVRRRTPESTGANASHRKLIELADKRQFEATRLRKRKPKGVARRKVK